jgi:hypothetical protein
VKEPAGVRPIDPGLQKRLKGGRALSLVNSKSAWRYLLAASVGAVATLVGCGGSSSNLVPVVGKVTVDGQPLTTGNGNVSFRPEKGSPSRQEPYGAIGPDGTYRLITDGKEGAPLGRYRVMVVDVEPIDPKSGFPYGKRKSHVNYKYSELKTTDLVIEVVREPAPGAYDLKLKK